MGWRRTREHDPGAGLRAGDPDALRAIHAELGPVVFGYLRHTLGDRATAEDVLQQVLLEVWRRGRDYDPARGSLVTWVMTIARSRAIDELRRRRPVPVDPASFQDVDDPGAPPETDLLLERWSVAALLARLPEDERELLRLRFYEELTQTEIAARTGIALGTVKGRMVRALERLRDELEAEAAAGTRALVEHGVPVEALR